MSHRARRSVALGTAAAVGLLLLAAPSPAQALLDLAAAAEPGEPYAALVALLSLLAWLLAGWLALTVLTTAAGHLPGAAGRAGTGVARRVAPTAVRRAVEVALGLSVAVGPLGGSPALAAPPAGPPVSAPALEGTAPPPTPPLDWAAPPAPPPVSETAVVVQPGDTLWDLAEQDLTTRTGARPSDAEVAQAWPSWWAANRDAVGEDPDLIQPGTPLRPPGDAPASS